MKRLAIILIVGTALALSMISCHAETLQQAADVFEITDDGREMQTLTALAAGTEYEVLERLTTQADTAFDSYFYSQRPIVWARIAFRDSSGMEQQGWIVTNPDAVTGIKIRFDANSSEEYNGYDTGFVLCESLSAREEPDGKSNTLCTLIYGTHCTVIEENDNWYQVVYRNEEGKRERGWVRKEYVLVNPGYFTPDAETPVYALPSRHSKRVGLIDEGTQYPIIGEYEGFLVISLRGASGFVEKP